MIDLTGIDRGVRAAGVRNQNHAGSSDVISAGIGQVV
jgi:hypothetical protein